MADPIKLRCSNQKFKKYNVNGNKDGAKLCVEAHDYNTDVNIYI